MRYDDGFGRRGNGGDRYDWTFRYQGGGHGYDHGYRDASVGGRRAPYERPWVGGYRDEYQGGSGGHAVNTTGPWRTDRTIAGRDGFRSEYDRNFAMDRARMGSRRRPGGARQGFGAERGMVGYDRDFGARGGGGEYGGDYRGGQERGGRQGRDEFRNEGRPEDYHPRFSPIGGMHPAMGGSYLNRPVPRPLANNEVASWYTRWF